MGKEQKPHTQLTPELSPAEDVACPPGEQEALPEEDTQALPGPEALPGQDAAPAPRRTAGGWLRWVAASLWLALALAGWALLLLGSMGNRPEVSGTGASVAYRPRQVPALTQGDWYQWDADGKTLYRWRFRDDGMAEVTPVGGGDTRALDYRVSEESRTVTIGYVSDPVIWLYDAPEGCYWQKTQGEKIRIFPADATPPQTPWAYIYP